MKVYLILEYFGDQCRVHSIYGKREKAEERAINLAKQYIKTPGLTFHVIKKKVIGKIK